MQCCQPAKHYNSVMNIDDARSCIYAAGLMFSEDPQVSISLFFTCINAAGPAHVEIHFNPCLTRQTE